MNLTYHILFCFFFLYFIGLLILSFLWLFHNSDTYSMNTFSFTSTEWKSLVTSQNDKSLIMLVKKHWRQNLRTDTVFRTKMIMYLYSSNATLSSIGVEIPESSPKDSQYDDALGDADWSELYELLLSRSNSSTGNSSQRPGEDLILSGMAAMICFAKLTIWRFGSSESHAERTKSIVIRKYEPKFCVLTVFKLLVFKWCKIYRSLE